MPTVQKMIRCKACRKKTLHVQDKPSHVLHLILTLVTFGLWVIVWVWAALLSGAPQCTQCGKSVGMFQIVR